jgi:hypothetical protein
MDAPERGALTLVRIVGAMLVVVTVLELGLYLAECYNPRQPRPVQALSLVLRLVPALAGIVVLARARAIAEWISNILDL